MKRSAILLCMAILMAVPTFAQEEIGILFLDPVYATIAIDGDMSDWEDVEPAYIDTVGDGGEYFDFAAVYIANDADYLFIRVTFAEPEPYGDFPWYMNIGFDMDIDPATGFPWAPGFGAEFVVQGASVFDQRDCDFVCIDEPAGPENNWGAFYFVDVAPFELTTDFEVRIPRDLTFSNDAEGLPGLSIPDGSLLFDPVFDEFAIVIEAQDADFNSAEWMPNPDLGASQTGFWYSFAPVPADVPSWDVH